MFTGIIKDLGRVEKLEKRPGKTVISVSTRLSPELVIGDSLAVNGCCLTISQLKNTFVTLEATAPTLKGTTLQYLNRHAMVNLEPAVKASDALGGHFVLGHVDTIGMIRGRVDKKDFMSLSVEIPARYRSYLVEKGSVAIDGVSLTIAVVKGAIMHLTIVPHTFENTLLKYRRVSDRVNVEFDYLVKIVSGLINKH